MKQKQPDLISRLEAAMQEKNLSAVDVSKLVGCSFSQIYRWLRREAAPTFIFRKQIDKTIKKIRKMSPVITLEMKDRDLYRKIKRKISYKEKQALFAHAGNYEAYRKELQKLAGKYNITK